MRKRDLGILLISLFSVFISLQHEGSFKFKEAWFHAFEVDHNPEVHEAELLPPPVAMDLNGDGRKEVIHATYDGKIQVIETSPPISREPFRNARLLAEVSLLPSNVQVTTGRQAVALSVGYLDGPVTDHGTKRMSRKAVIVVVTAGWSILCFDHNLKLMWENSVQEDFPHGARHKEVAVLIANQTMHVGDRGVVIVGGSMELHPQKFTDPLEEEEEEEEAEARHRGRAGPKDDLEDVSKNLAGLKERHFSYYAYNGADGALRWQHDSKDFHRDASALSEKLLPQHNYKLDASALNGRHFGEVECREFRESVLQAMPHQWSHRDDTRFSLSHFRKHRRRPHKAQGGPPAPHAPHHAPLRNTVGRDHSNAVARAVGRTVQLALSDRPRAAGAHHGNLSEHWWAPNALVVHLREGIEALHLYSGRTICKLLLKEGGLHADVNGDGVLDHVQVSGSVAGEQEVATGLHQPLKPCWAVATSGVPVREVLFNGTICHPDGAHWDPSGLGAGEETEHALLAAAPPVLLPRADGHRHRRGSHGDLLFLNSRGEVTSYQPSSLRSHRAMLRWQISTSASWQPLDAYGDAGDASVVPTLKVFSLRANPKAVPDAVLAGGDSVAVVLSPNGYVAETLSYPLAPTGPLIVTDFNGDGWNDILAVTSIGIYAYLQVRQPGMALFSALLGFIIVGVSVVFVTQAFGSSKGKKPRRRSTD